MSDSTKIGTIYIKRIAILKNADSRHSKILNVVPFLFLFNVMKTKLAAFLTLTCDSSEIIVRVCQCLIWAGKQPEATIQICWPHGCREASWQVITQPGTQCTGSTGQGIRRSGARSLKMPMFVDVIWHNSSNTPENLSGIWNPLDD